MAGGAAPLRERGEEAGALRRDFRGFDWKSSYSSANENRSLYLGRGREGEGGGDELGPVPLLSP